MSRLNVLCMFTFCMCFAARDPPLVTIPGQGIIMGKEITRYRSQKIIGYHGIPYAQPPLDGLRFAPPSTDNLEPWNGTRNGTEYRPACLQTEKDIREEVKPFMKIIFPSLVGNDTDEDCLYLNVFVPYGKPPKSGFATIVWIHPGNFTTGSPAMWNPHPLVYRYRIILVTFSWRLGIMGFFTTMDGEAPGNFGLMDQQAAMMWVKKNIRYFGGNEDNISLMGYGTGGVSVGIHMINQISRQYFNKAIVMSANLLRNSVVKEQSEDKSLFTQISKIGNCNVRPTSAFIDCLRNLHGKRLVEETSNINWRPLLDDKLSNSTMAFLPDYPKVILEGGDFYKVPFLTGYTNMEDILGYIDTIDMFQTGNITNDNLRQILFEIARNDLPSSNSSEGECLNLNVDHIADTLMFFYGPDSSSGIKDVDALRKIVADFTTEMNYAASTYLHATYVSKEQPTYVYRFDLKPTTKIVADSLPDWVAVPHLYDLIYIWGMPYWNEFDNVINWEVRDKRISEIMMSFWTNFAKTSDPKNGSLYAIRWENFTEDNPQLLIMDGSFNMSNSKTLNYKSFEFWNYYYPKIMLISKQCCESPNNGVHVKVSYMFILIACMTHYVHLL